MPALDEIQNLCNRVLAVTGTAPPCDASLLANADSAVFLIGKDLAAVVEQYVRRHGYTPTARQARTIVNEVYQYRQWCMNAGAPVPDAVRRAALQQVTASVLQVIADLAEPGLPVEPLSL